MGKSKIGILSVQQKTCSVDGCEKPIRSSGSEYCAMHYHRLYRNGTLDKVAKPATTKAHSGGYVLVPSGGHFLARGSSHVYEHRKVFHDNNGDGPFGCHWCGTHITWDTLHIDHLDDDKKNNSTSNLVASCPSCNMGRGQHKIQDTWRSKVGLSALGMNKTLNEWAEFAGMSRSSILDRMRRGATLEDAVTRPKSNRGPKPKNGNMTDWRKASSSPAKVHQNGIQ